MTTKKRVVFTDVDGTLLDDKYSFKETQPTIIQLQASGVAIVLVSSKTRVELEYYRQKLGIADPFISENGAAVFIPKGYFAKPHRYTKQTSQYNIVELGVPYATIREKLASIRKNVHFAIWGFGDRATQEVAADTGLSFELAALAKQREYTEPIQVEEQGKERFLELAAWEGLFVVRGDRYFHLTGAHDKGKAVSVLKLLYEGEFAGLESFGVGNGENDYAMLRMTDHGFFIKSPEQRGAVWAKILAEAQAT